MASQKAPLLYRLFSHVLLFGLCIGLPAVVMLIMPVASTSFVRADGNVSATVVKKAFFVIPFHIETIAGVTSVDDEYQAGVLSKTSPSGPKSDPMRPQSRTEDMSWLLIRGKDQTAQVPVSPADIDDVRRRVREFLEDGGQSELKIFTVANWKISVITGGALSLLTLLYLGCMGWGILSMLFRSPAQR